MFNLVMWYFAFLLALWLGHGTAGTGAQPSEVPAWLKEYDFDPPLQCSANAAGPLDPRDAEAVCPLPIDDETAFERRSWRPWTFPPVCIKPEKARDPKLCVYTYQKLRGDTGVSILTTPETAAAGVGIVEDADPKWVDWARGSPLVVADPPPYEFQELEGRGVGVVANRTIRAGEVVMLRYPVLVRHMDPRPWKQQESLKLLHRAAVQLPPRDGLRMMELAHSKGGYIIDDIINTNAFGVLINDVDHSGFMFSRFSSTTLGMEVVAYRDIKPGEELTFSCEYFPPVRRGLVLMANSDTPLNLLSEQRQSLIREWGFNCTCSLCSSPNESAASDRRRGRIQDLLGELDRPEIRNHAAVEKRVSEILDLCQKEAMAAQVGDFYTIVADVYSSMGDLDSARRYGELALRELKHFAGYDHDRTRSAIMFLENLDRKVRV
ncbi:hypothetical protein Hte_008994 [Hypoxylon texense]